MSGSITFAGLPSDRVPGNTYTEKRRNVMTMTVDEISKCIADLGGFLCKFTDGVTGDGECGIIVPSGFMILTASENARILRWSMMSDDNDRARVKESLTNMLTSFDEFTNPNHGYVHFARHLGVDMF